MTLDKIILAASIAIASVLGYLITSTCLLYPHEYERGCNNAVASACHMMNCTDGQEHAAMQECMMHKDL